ncbi:hypothetical protein WJ55_17065 [Burkholderia ubonensis]|nr:hypothetical protein WI83_23630 [Burkholderia ubonensis]KVG74317.1 hypothetical protein WJ34_12870 [Burkholderia ubonensis]KVH24901.1 hypothetical protein WJ37_08085 [Burkholderia ubonensis]KVH51682.1 hypothetical protein WJ38_08185 [Burkholderia ubonensis]KVH86147.1 hypothetical protein WJ43_08495 [Burkholderia ubonensis]
MLHLGTSQVSEAAQRVAGHVERVAVGRRKCGGAQCVANDLEGKLRLLRMSTSLGGHDADSYVS